MEKTDNASLFKDLDESIKSLRIADVVKESSTKNIKSSKIRELLNIVISCIPKIKNIEFTNKDGDIRFEILSKDIGITYDIYNKYKEEIFSSLFSSTVGELLIRENINKFACILTSLDKDNFNGMVNKYEHKKFGLEAYRDKIAFRFHISLVRNILTEDFRNKII
jgi:hypothetical protein